MIFEKARDVIKGGVLISLSNGKDVGWKRSQSQRGKFRYISSSLSAKE